MPNVNIELFIIGNKHNIEEIIIFIVISIFWGVVLFKSFLYQHVISKQIDLNPWDMIDNL